MRSGFAQLAFFAPILLFAALFTAIPGRTQAVASAAAQSGAAEINGTKIYYEVAGAGHPLVLIHGGQMDSRMWDDQFHLFSKTYRVVRFDVRGYGKSPASKNVYASEDDLAALLKFLKIEKAYIVGLSLGGRIAIDFALRHPEMTDGIVPVAPGLSGFHFTEDPSEWNILRAVQAGDFAKATDYWLQTGYMAPAMGNPQIAPRLRQLSLDNVHENLDNPLLETMPNPPAIDRLSQIKAPTLIIVGNRDVADIHEICGLLRARIPGAKEIVIEGSGHIVNMENPEEFNRAVLDFLGSHSK
jgi:pimeloyl-ACP methyl ester carboxylesterase